MTSMIDVTSPADGRRVGQIGSQLRDSVSDVVASLRGSQPAWEGIGPHDRAGWLRRYRDWLLDNHDRLCGLLQAETGKPWTEANLDLPYVVDVTNYYAKNAARFLADQRPARHSLLTITKRQLVTRRAYPVVGVITPWNFPLGLTLIDAVPALLAGASVVVKPSEFTPLATRAAVDGWTEIGAPPVFACVTGAGETGAAVVDEVDYVQFTGSTRTGKAIAKSAATRLIPCSLELGGKDAMLVLADADLPRAANAAVWGGIANAGQMCTSVERVYVEASVYDEFVNLVTDRVRALRLGSDATGYRYDVGPLATSTQVDIVRRHVADALERGARVLVGGQNSGQFFEPTVLVDVDHSMLCMTEETFGPTLPIMRVADVDEAVQLANDSAYGLSATIFSRDTRRAEEVARLLQSGAVNINDVFSNLFALPVPQSGWKQSGMGARNGGVYGIQKFTRPQAIVTSRLMTPRSELTWYPYTASRTAVLRRAARLLGAGDLRRKLF
ncbi:aldehyde dehydrogenase family protein [Nocardioides sp. LML1-1-1.1]